MFKPKVKDRSALRRAFSFKKRSKVFSLNPCWQISEALARPISGKLIQSSILEFRSITQADYWKLIQLWTSFPEIGVAQAPGIEISENFLDEFSKICQ